MKNTIERSNLVVIEGPLSFVLTITQSTSSSSTSTGALLRTSGYLGCDSWDGFDCELDCELNCEFLEYAILICLESLRDSKISLNLIPFLLLSFAFQ